MRIGTILQTCDALHIILDEILTQENPSLSLPQEELTARLNTCPNKEIDTAQRLPEVCLQSPGCAP